MNVASLELCKELYELSGWNDVETVIDPPRFGFPTPEDEAEMRRPKTAQDVISDINNKWGPESRIPRYTLGYLLRKLPTRTKAGSEIFISHTEGDRWVAGCNNIGRSFADIPEDAACLLAIELIKQGIVNPLSKKDNK